jgi:hypothetical protein
VLAKRSTFITESTTENGLEGNAGTMREKLVFSGRVQAGGMPRVVSVRTDEWGGPENWWSETAIR